MGKESRSILLSRCSRELTKKILLLQISLNRAVEVALFDGVAFFVLAFAAGEGDFEFDFVAGDEDTDGHDGEPIGLTFGFEVGDLAFVEEKLSGTGGVDIFLLCRLRIWTDMHVRYIRLVATNRDERAFQVHRPCFHRFYLSAGQH